MAKCYQNALPFPRLGGRRVEVEFSGGDITSNGGSPLLPQVDSRLGLSDAVARVLHDPRRRASCRHRLVTLVRQRLHALVLGYEDLNDHQTLRHDAGLQTAASSDAALASPATLCRWEQTATRADAIGLHRVLFEGLRRLALGDTELATASPDRIRLTLLRIGAVVVRNTCRIRFLPGSAWPHQDLFRTVAWRLDSS